ncbi:hypothetical protein DVH24_008335 [Malus domestica]|uniref:Uncharacterized protein n=1 Tax=Malus domestica TaxID=3750 RepID=A0A498JL94_MALDO|nr:hypothetical protein DVH24_008335 [Malus domestica]
MKLSWHNSGTLWEFWCGLEFNVIALAYDASDVCPSVMQNTLSKELSTSKFDYARNILYILVFCALC